MLNKVKKKDRIQRTLDGLCKTTLRSEVITI